MCLDENHVVEAVCNFLESRGATIEQRCTTGERGIDIVARLPDRRKLLVEVKGGTSSKSGTERYGKEFDRRQVFDVVAKAFYAAACYRSNTEYEGAEIAMAFPLTDRFLRYIKPLAPAVINLKLGLFLVSQDQSVTCLAMPTFRAGTEI